MDAQMTGGVGDVSMEEADAMLGFGHDSFLDADDLNGLLPLDVDLDGLANSASNNLQQQPQQNLDNTTTTAASNVQPSVEETGDGHDAAAAEALSGPGAGPLPASYGIQLPANAGSTLTEFTKRRNWSQRVIEELKDFLHVLTPDGRIIYASPSTRSLTGHEPNNLVGEFISDYIHPDDNGMFVREFNESIASGNPLRFYYRFRKPDGHYTIFESHGHPHIASDPGAYASDNNAPLCRGFFMMARPYPTKNASLLDSFLEHKIENERLKKRIADLKREEQEDMDEQQRQWNVRQMDMSVTPTGPHGDHGGGNMRSTGSDSPQNFDGMPPPAKPTASNLALTRQNLSDALAASRPDSINDKMARYEGVSHLETIEMLTGLRYRDGERSKGISTGAASPTLLRGDQGIAISADKDRFGRSYSGSPYGDMMSDRDKKKKMKVADEYVCTDCGTLDSPEWRKGPTGPKTLCNACGLRWAKKEKKKSGGPDTSPSHNTSTNNGGTTSSTTPNAKSHGGNGQGGNGQGGANIQTGLNQGPSAATSANQGMIMPAQAAAAAGQHIMPQGMQYMGLSPSMQGSIPNHLAMGPSASIQGNQPQ